MKKQYRILRRRALFAIATAVTPLGGSKAFAAGAPQNDSWINANGGTWDNPLNWSLNAAPITTAYNAIIALQANPYTVDIVDSFSVNAITLNSSSATILDTGGTVTTPTITIDAGTFNLNGGTLSNAAVSVAGGSFTAMQGTLSGISVTGGDLNVLASGTVDIQNGLTITQHNLVLGSTSSTLFDGNSQTLSALNVAPSSNYAYIYVGGVHSSGAATLTIAANTFVSGGVLFNDYTGNGTLINNGSIFESSTARAGSISINSFVNNGTAEASGGGTLLLGGTYLANSGTIGAIGGSTINLSGTFATTGLGTVNVDSTSTLKISGTANNAGATLKPSGGTWVLAGTINGGTVDESTQPLVINSGTLNGVTIAGADLQLPQQQALYVQGGLTIADHNLDVGYAANLYFDGKNESIDNLNINTTASLAVIKLGFTTTGTTNLSLTLGSSNTISGPFEIFQNTNSLNDTLTNNGTMSTNSGTLYVETAIFNNYGTLSAAGGTTVANSGNLEVDALHFTNYGTIALGANSTLRFIASNFTENGTLTTTGAVSALNTTVTFGSGTIHNTGTLSLTGTSVVSQPVTSSDTLSGPLMLAPTTGDLGNYTISAGTLNCQQSALVGSNGLGTFTQTAGTTTITGALSAGNTGVLTAGSGSGTINISGGTLYADTVLLGSTAHGSGMMVVSGNGNVTIGGGAHLNDLTVNAGTVTVLNQTPPAGEDPELNRALVGGYLTNGALYVNGGNVITPTIKLGLTLGYTGTFSQTAGTVNVGTLGAGNDANLASGSGIGMVNISGGTLTVNTVLLGSTAGGSGNMTVTGTGDVIIGGGAHLNDLNVNAGSVTVLAQAAPAGEDPELFQALVGGYLTNGALNVSATGLVTTPYIKLGITQGYTGTFNQTGGTVNVGTLCVGDDFNTASGSGIGSTTVSAGTLNIGTLLIGSSAGGVGTVNISGTADVHVTSVLNLTAGTFTMSAGSLSFDNAIATVPAGNITIGNSQSTAALHLHNSKIAGTLSTLTIAAHATLDGGSDESSTDVGTVQFSNANLTLSGSTSVLHMTLGGNPTSGNAGVTFDQITETGGVFTVGGATLQILPLSNLMTNMAYPIVVASNGGLINYSTVFSSLTIDPQYGSYTPVYSVHYSASEIDVTFSTPEPASAAILAFAATTLCRRRRRTHPSSL